MAKLKIMNTLKVPANTLCKKANEYTIDWCIHCAIQAIDKKDTNKLMFSYIFINLMKACGKPFYCFTEQGQNLLFSFKKGFLKEWDNPCIEAVKYKKAYYGFLTQILKTFLIDNCQDYDDRKFEINIEDDTIKVEIC